MAGEIGFFELGVTDVERGRAFYEGLFGWPFERGPAGGWHIETGGAPGGIHGGDARACPDAFIAVDDMDAATTRAHRSACTSRRGARRLGQVS